MKSKQVVLGAILVVLVGISVFVWKSVGMSAEGDQTVMAMKQKFTCGSCKADFELSVAEAAAMRQNNEGNIVCPACSHAGAEKQGAIVNLSPTFNDDEPEDEAMDETEEERPAAKVGGRVKKTNS